MPHLKADIHKQASIVYNKLYRTYDKVNNFFADTGQYHLDGKVGIISSYDIMNCFYVAKVCNVNQCKSSSWTESFISPENMEPYIRIIVTTYKTTPSSDSVEVTFVNHFASSHPTLDPTILFDSNIFSEIGGFYATSPLVRRRPTKQAFIIT